MAQQSLTRSLVERQFGALTDLAVALGTLYLAYFTSQAVSSTERLIANDHPNHRTDRTIAIMKEYNQIGIPVTDFIAMSPHEASSQLIVFSKKMDELLLLKSQYDENSTEPQHQQYRAIVTSVPTVINFYMVNLQLLRREVLDEQLFMNMFARTL